MRKKHNALLWSDRKRTIFGLPLSFTAYGMEEERFFIRKGFFTTTEDEVRLYRITDVSLRRTLWQKIFGLGTIACCSADKTLHNFEIKNIKHPQNVKEQLSYLVEKERDAKRVSGREYLCNGDDFPDDEINN